MKAILCDVCDNKISVKDRLRFDRVIIKKDIYLGSMKVDVCIGCFNKIVGFTRAMIEEENNPSLLKGEKE